MVIASSATSVLSRDILRSLRLGTEMDISIGGSVINWIIIKQVNILNEDYLHLFHPQGLR